MTTTTNLVPTIESTTLPTIPADEWTSNTNGVLSAQKPTRPQDMGPPFPRSFTEELTPRQLNSKSTLLDTAKTYLPGPDDVQHAMTSVGQAAKTYLPQSVAAYLSSASSSSLETNPDLAPLHPPFLADLPVTGDSELRTLRTLSTEAQPGSLLPPRVDSVATTSTSPSLSNADSGHLSTTVHTSGPASPHPVVPLLPADINPNFERGVPTPPATLAESPAQLSSSSLSLSTPSAQSDGPPVPENSLVTPSTGVSTNSPTRTQLPALPSPAVFDDAPNALTPTSIDHDRSVSNSLAAPSPGASTSLLTRTQLPALPSPAAFDDAPTAPAPTSIDHDRSVSAPAPVLPPFALPSASAVRASGMALPGASSPSSACGSTPRPGSADSKFVEGISSPMLAPAAAEPSPIVQTEGSSALQNTVASPTLAPHNTPAVPGFTPIDPGLGSANGAPDVVVSHAPQGYIAARDGVAQGKDAPLQLDTPHFRVVDSGAAFENTETAPPVPPKTDSPDLAPPPTALTVASPPLPPAPATAAHDGSGTDNDSGSGSGSDAADAGADAAAGKKQRRKKPKLLQRLKEKMHVGHARA